MRPQEQAARFPPGRVLHGNLSPGPYGPHGHEAPKTPQIPEPKTPEVAGTRVPGEAPYSTRDRDFLESEVLLAQGQARKEKVWKHMDPQERLNYQAAGEKQWEKWTTNSAVEVMSFEESKKVRQELKDAKKTDRVMSTRWVLTDKNDPVRTTLNKLPLDASMLMPELFLTVATRIGRTSASTSA